MQALGGYRPSVRAYAGHGRVQAARRGLCQPWEHYRPPGGGCAGPERV